jgi:hypothetical protein
MAWDSTRPIPWKRLGLWLGVYAVLMIGLTLLTNKDDVGNVLPGIAVGVVLAALVLITLTKFGWKLPMLMSKQESAKVREERIAARVAARNARKGVTPAAANTTAGPRPRPAPTSRTTTGPSQHPRPKGRKK